MKTMRKWLLLVLALILLCVIVCAAIYIFTVHGISGEPPSNELIQEKTHPFILALQNKQYDVAKQMFLGEIQPAVSINALEELSDKEPITDFVILEICEYRLVFGDRGKKIVGSGLLHYYHGITIVESTLIQDTDYSWYLYNFQLLPDERQTASGLCIIPPK